MDITKKIISLFLKNKESIDNQDGIREIFAPTFCVSHLISLLVGNKTF
jgi:hypothetical protein